MCACACNDQPCKELLSISGWKKFYALVSETPDTKQLLTWLLV